MKSIARFIPGVVFLLYGCSFDVTELQSIDIDTYPEKKKNVELVHDLIYYDPRYIAHKVPSYDAETSKGIKLSAFVRSSDGEPSYRVTYSMKVPAVSENITSLKSDFETHIPELAAVHASKAPLFSELSIAGKRWAESLLINSISDIYSASSSLLKKSVSEKEFVAAIGGLYTDYGSDPTSTEFVRAQHYETFFGIPESVALYYTQDFSNNRKALLRLNVHQQDSEWVVMGFRVEPSA